MNALDGYWQAAEERESSVLVAIVPRLADWHHIVKEGWYHIPLSKAPAQIAADRLAFYHPACFPETRFSISYYADVNDYEVCPRSVLFPDMPLHPRADAPYYRLSLGPVKPLPWVVPAARLRRITFIRTTWSLLLQANDVTDLWPHAPRHGRLARELQEPLARPYHMLASVPAWAPPPQSNAATLAASLAGQAAHPGRC